MILVLIEDKELLKTKVSDNMKREFDSKPICNKKNFENQNKIF